MAGLRESVMQSGDMGWAYLAAAADDAGAGFDPTEGLVSIGLRIKIVAGVQYVDRAAML